MTKDEILLWFSVKRGDVCIDRSELAGLPGYLRHVTLRAPARIEIEFLWHASEEGGPTFVADAEDLESLILATEVYLARPICDWENFSTTSRYPEIRANITRDPRTFRVKLIDGSLPLPSGLRFTIREAYWRDLAEHNSRT